ncbi:porin [Sutterella wadsworthensis]|uniref:porin n=1 Tax=Sutterella wadsworthensis TaxID=40545 RepID=UPI003A939534
MATSNTPAYTHITLASALLVLCGVLPQSVSAAQTEVYGKLETSIRYMHVNGSGNKLEMLNEGSRWGLKIKEDLSNELSVRGYLESGFNSDDGGLSTTNTLFDRRSILALNSKTFGEIGFGRMGSVRSTMSPYSLGLAWMDPFETGYGTDSSISTIFGNDPRSSNMVTWVSPKVSGFRAGLTYSFNTAGQENTPNDSTIACCPERSPIRATVSSSQSALRSSGHHVRAPHSRMPPRKPSHSREPQKTLRPTPSARPIKQLTNGSFSPRFSTRKAGAPLLVGAPTARFIRRMASAGSSFRKKVSRG